MEIQDVIQQYHDLLTDEVAEEANALLHEKLKERSLYFGERPLCIVLRPHFYQEHDWEFMQRGLQGVLSAFSRAHEVCIADKSYRSQLHLEEYEEHLFPLDHGAPLPWSSSRIDTFYVVEDRNLKCVEYNAETPAGIGYNDCLADVFDALEPMQKFQEMYHLTPMRSLDTLQSALMKAYHGWGGREIPQIAILDWQDVPTLNEHEITRLYFEQHGYKAILADPRALEYRNGQLMQGDFRIDLIYKRVLYSELVERMGVDNPVLQAIKDRAVYMTNSPSAKLMAKKASLAFLSDERNADLFTSEQQHFINAHIPWTRVVEERKTVYDGQSVDLVQCIADNREKFVLKPNDEYGGSGVVLGWQSSQEEWEAKLQLALNTPHVVQEKVQLLQRDFPNWADGRLTISERYVDAAPYIFNGDQVYGCLTRLSPLALLNVTAGGGSVVPTYIIRNR
ncbi:MAG: circularly permuted type 2 ATP-grasp protein [Chloroflexota bacterium]